MEGSEKGFYPSKSTASPKPSSTGSGENNENDSSQDKLSPKFQNHKKMVAKHFMSPTISAASKAAAPRKKVLAERNENSSPFDTQNQKMSNLDMRKSPRNSSIGQFDQTSSRVFSSYNHASEPDDDGDTHFEAPSVKAYDPLTNYTSPRPKYLRFNPNRRRQILNRLEKEAREDLNSSLDCKEVNDEEDSSAEEVKDSSSFSPPKESVVKLENEENTEEEDGDVSDDYEGEEEEELEEGGRWCLKGVLKLLLTLFACLLSTSYICSMNSPTPSPTQLAIWSLKDGYLMIKEQTLEVISMGMHGAGFLEVEMRDNYGEVEEVKIHDDDNSETKESVEAEMVENNVENSERPDEEYVGNEKEEQTLEVISMGMHGAGFLEVEMGDNYGEVEEVKVHDDDNGETKESAQAEMVEDNVENSERPDKEYVGNEKEDSEDKIDKAAVIEDVRVDEFEFKAENFEHACVSCSEKKLESSYPGLDEDNIDKIETAEAEIVRGGEVESEIESFGQLIGAKTDESEDNLRYELEVEADGSNQLQHLEVSEKSISEEEKPQVANEMESLELIGVHEESTESGHEADEVAYDNGVEMEKAGWNTSAVTGVSIVSIIFTSLAIIYHSKKTRQISPDESEPVLKPHNFAVEKKVTQVLPSTKKKVEFFARPSLSHSTEEAPLELNHYISPPTVELIGEIVVGQVSCLRSYGSKHQTTESNSTFSVPIQPAALENPSTTSSPSYRSFTAATKILKKEGGRSGEAMTEVTPVRRSSRLRNRAAVTSP